ncbi:MAG: hypothetical protein R3C28_04635 [Pirellulaceae bacterium]
MDEAAILKLLERLQNRDDSALDELLPHVLLQVRRSYAKKLPHHVLAEMDDFFSEISLRLVKDYYRSAQKIRTKMGVLPVQNSSGPTFTPFVVRHRLISFVMPTPRCGKQRSKVGPLQGVFRQTTRPLVEYERPGIV